MSADVGSLGHSWVQHGGVNPVPPRSKVWLLVLCEPCQQRDRPHVPLVGQASPQTKRALCILEQHRGKHKLHEVMLQAATNKLYSGVWVSCPQPLHLSSMNCPACSWLDTGVPHYVGVFGCGADAAVVAECHGPKFIMHQQCLLAAAALDDCVTQCEGGQ